jgi:hypothetical protein
MPRKNGMQMPLFDYQKIICDALQHQTRHLWIKKATGLGITELMLRYMAWLCLRDNGLRGSQMCIVTGPRIDLAITLIDRIKKLFPTPPIHFDSKETVVELNGVKIEAFPSHHLDAMRGLPDVSFILIDEADFFPPGEQQDARSVAERYIAKSDPYIVMVSTPNAPGGLFEQIEKEEPSLYEKIFLDYRVGLGKIYSEEEIARARASPSFDTEYNLKYLGGIGNAFEIKYIQRAEELGKRVNYNYPDPDSNISMGLDPGFGSSKFGIVITQLRYAMIEVIYTREIPNSAPTDIILHAHELYNRYNVENIYVDNSNPGYIKELKRLVGEESDYDKVKEQVAYARKKGLSPSQFMKVVPVSFGKDGKEMLSHTQKLLALGQVAIHPDFRELLTQMRSATVEMDGNLDKSKQSLDLIDALRLCLLHYEPETTMEEVV